MRDDHSQIRPIVFDRFWQLRDRLITLNRIMPSVVMEAVSCRSVAAG